ncbi:hypothetical protein K493DRAFT_304138 [Basidiobolus meristosporus CBS 931.73]|uniref:Uncharacterized protein n=1 Tax=Basidiobolus meristosporus CBS 931.73 TaxID=1314790 RepID=A0A1Y1Y0U5_9FUNG|nr:hypothetical protein K493DRAFT_304138 [Basidiobolus meristosporus CBS 931.73]|eukprot:ORX91336.1 hypothetical protein K493DRAFT_304138 [Basidiobolus meristosporus CBS 931.73]
MESLIIKKLLNKLTLSQYFQKAPHYHQYILTALVQAELLLAFMTSLCNDRNEYHELLCSLEDTTTQMSPSRRTELWPLPDDLLKSIKETTATALDFIQDTYLHSLPQWRKQTFEVNCIKHESMVTGSHISNKETEQTVFACVLWMSKSANATETVKHLRSVMRCTREVAFQKVDTALAEGRVVIELSTDIERLVRVGNSLSDCGLHITIRSGRDTFREEVAGLLLKWLQELCSRHLDQREPTIAQIVCGQLLSTWRGSAEVDRLLGLSSRTNGGYLQLDLLLLHRCCLSQEANAYLRRFYSSAFANYPARKTILGNENESIHMLEVLHTKTFEASRFATLCLKLTGKPITCMLAAFNQLDHEYDFVTLTLGALRSHAIGPQSE